MNVVGLTPDGNIAGFISANFQEGKNKSKFLFEMVMNNNMRNNI